MDLMVEAISFIFKRERQISVLSFNYHFEPILLFRKLAIFIKFQLFLFKQKWFFRSVLLMLSNLL